MSNKYKINVQAVIFKVCTTMSNKEKIYGSGHLHEWQPRVFPGFDSVVSVSVLAININIFKVIRHRD